MVPLCISDKGSSDFALIAPLEERLINGFAGIAK